MNKLQVIPLGGLGEFGMHMMALRFGDDILVIDSGMMFPEDELLGVDLVTPDLTYLRDNREKVRALILTHGHEDHIGAVPFFLSDFNVPVYGTAFTLALVERRLEEWDLAEDPRFNTIKPGPVPGWGGRLQAPHIEVSVFARGLLDRVVTRIYFPDETEANAADPVLAAIDDPQRRATLVAREEHGDLRFDIHLQGESETVFFAI